MLKLKGITKDYAVGDETVHALKGIDLEFRKSEFVAVLGHSVKRPLDKGVHRPRLEYLQKSLDRLCFSVI